MASSEHPMSMRVKLWSWFMVSQAVSAGVSLLAQPTRTEEVFFWRITPPINAVLFGAIYLIAGLQLAWETWRGRWETRRYFTPMLVVFSAGLLMATLLHSDRFVPGTKLFWWTLLYLAVPIIEIILFPRLERSAVQRPVGTVVAPLTRRLAVGLGAGVVVLGVAAFAMPAVFIPLVPWTITPLMVRVFATAGLAIGTGLVWFARESDWNRLVGVSMMLIGLAGSWTVLIAGYRGDVQGDPTRLGLLLLFLAVMGGTGLLMWWLQRGERAAAGAAGVA